MKKRILWLGILLLTIFSLNAVNLKIYCEDDPPFQIVDKNGKLKGLTTEIVQEIQKRVHNTDPIEVVPWARGYNILENNPNVVLFSMSRTAERNHLFQWVGPVNEISYVLYGRKDSKALINVLDDAKKLNSIGVYKDDVRDIFLTKMGFTNLDRVTETSINIRKIMMGRLDAYADSDDGFVANVESAGFNKNDFKPLYVFMKSQLFIAFSKSTDPKIVKGWNDALTAMKKDGTFKNIYWKYFPGKELPGPAITSF